jgi:hypothetical protein
MPSLRPSGQTWSMFVRNHTTDIGACDFVQTYDGFFRTIFVFVIIELGSRRVIHVNGTRSPSDACVAQQLRKATPPASTIPNSIRSGDVFRWANTVSWRSEKRLPHAWQRRRLIAPVLPRVSCSTRA